MKALIWNTHRKNTRKCSKVSRKKYQKRPRLGVLSGTDRLKKRVRGRERRREREIEKEGGRET